MQNLSLDRIGFRNLTAIEHDIVSDVFAVAAMDYGQVATKSQAKATDYYGAGLEGSCSLSDVVSDVVLTYDPLSPITDYIMARSTGDWRPRREMRSKGKPPISAVMPVCCGIKPQSAAANNGILTYGRTAIATAIEICDLDKWQAASSDYKIDLEGEAIADRLEALTEVSNMIAIRGGYGLKGIRGNSEYPAVYMAQPFTNMGATGEALYKAILNIVQNTSPNYTPPGGYTLALPPRAMQALNRPYSNEHTSSVLSVLMGTCGCTIPGIQTGILKEIVSMPHLACAALGVGSGDMGLLFVREFLEWDLPVPFQTIEPDRCGLISIGAVVANVGEVIQKRQGHAVKIFNV